MRSLFILLLLAASGLAGATLVQRCAPDPASAGGPASETDPAAGSDPAIVAVEQEIASLETLEAEISHAAEQAPTPEQRASFQAEQRRIQSKLKAAKIQRNALLDPLAELQGL